MVKEDFGNGLFISNEINKVYLLHPAVPLNTLSYQKSEIDELVWVDKNASITSEFCIPQEEWSRAIKLIF